MKALKIGVSALALTLIAGGSAMAAEATGTATATIKAPISVANASALDFGTIISPAADATETGSISFDVSGEAQATYTLSVMDIDLENAAGDTMALTFQSADQGTRTIGGTAPGSHTDVGVSVGATLAIGANQASGTYEGDYTVTVNY
ncbi:DUF4402 domain-containing protein [Roseospirillum parvum]|uniref:DUF4402 domain-containing protein n=1 Tax=Roseospirillum parvum TaxID=83401 RepID=A0A1G8FB56_9PROT|nr:DUF4402 domain-containing protein [Roseospirillum parvum]SDH79312.1 protein of unknown function [Roseospirillum parvum]